MADITQGEIESIIERIARAAHDDGLVLMFTTADGQLIRTPTNEQNARVIQRRVRAGLREP